MNLFVNDFMELIFGAVIRFTEVVILPEFWFLMCVIFLRLILKIPTTNSFRNFATSKVLNLLLALAMFFICRRTGKVAV